MIGQPRYAKSGVCLLRSADMLGTTAKKRYFEERRRSTMLSTCYKPKENEAIKLNVLLKINYEGKQQDLHSKPPPHSEADKPSEESNSKELDESRDKPKPDSKSSESSSNSNESGKKPTLIMMIPRKAENLHRKSPTSLESKKSKSKEPDESRNKPGPDSNTSKSSEESKSDKSNESNESGKKPHPHDDDSKESKESKSKESDESRNTPYPDSKV
nr:unnamed protein product [Callosobruchus chinensis]